MNGNAEGAIGHQLAFGGLALACALCCAFLSVHHPLLGVWALLPCALAALAGHRAPGGWPLWLLPLLPLIGGMPWTGWLSVEELDLLVLAASAGAYARWALPLQPRPPARPSQGTALGLLLLALYGAALGVSMWRGLADAGGLVWGWWQGYHEPMNALRLAKSFVLALLLLPLWLRLHREQPARATRHVLAGITAMLAVVALAVLWERVAFTGIMNFSSDYRASGPFWEMHVGGAALDAVLALSVPFAAAAGLDARRGPGWVLTASVLALAAYACLATFSRIVYVAVPLSLALLVALRARQHDGSVHAGEQAQGAMTAALLATYSVAAALIFVGAGYRGLLALLGVFALALPLGASGTRLGPRSMAVSLALAFGIAVLCGAVASWLPKGAYVGYAVAWSAGAASAAVIEHARRGGGRAPANALTLLMATTLACCAGLYFVARTWGGHAAEARAAATAGALAAAVLAIGLRGRPCWPASARWQVSRIAALSVLGLAIGVFAGGSYMGGRWSVLGEDLAARVEHARGAIALLNGPGDLLFGRGLGRYATAQFMSGNPEDQTGDYRWVEDREGRRLLLTSGKHILGWGQLFRVSQRTDAPGEFAKVRVRVRVDGPTELHGEICEKHLLYNGACLTGQTTVNPEGAAWQDVEWDLKGNPPTRGHWFAPRFIVFSLALGTQGSKAEFDSVQLLAGDERQLLANSSFSNGMAHWFFSSDHHHLPWHAKNLLVHLIFEQGIVGCALMVMLVGGALWRLTAGGLRRHALAPPLAAALLGVCVVGIADSLLDIPRVAFLMYLLIGMALLLPSTQAAPPRTS